MRLRAEVAGGARRHRLLERTGAFGAQASASGPPREARNEE